MSHDSEAPHPNLDQLFKKHPGPITRGEPKLPIDPYEALLRAKDALDHSTPKPGPPPLRVREENHSLKRHLRVVDEEIYLLSRQSRVPFHLLTSRPLPPLLNRLRLRIRHRLQQIRRIVRPSR